jgi:hypothetical protein
MRVESVRENRIEAVRIRDHEPDSRGSRNGRGSGAVVDAVTARGAGRPRLTRPLVVDHLP